MDSEFWQQRWREGRIGFHQAQATPLLVAHWPTLELPRDSRVFVPLAGKSLDMPWLAAQGHRVLGVELSPLAVARFFEERGLVPRVHDSHLGRHHVAGAIELICGDVFDLDAQVLADCAAVYDRAALIALPPELRRRYVRELHARLPAGCRGLLISMEYPPHEKQGPPFAVPETEVRELYGRDWQVATLERRDILAQQPGFVAEGVSALETVVYRLSRKG
jgi:thiopurine S-methyltransferase